MEILTNNLKIELYPVDRPIDVQSQTIKKVEALGEASDYVVYIQGPGDLNVEAVVRYIRWLNGERHVECIRAEGHSLLSTVVGRLRLEVGKHSEELDIVTLRIALLSSLEPPHATLFLWEPEYFAPFGIMSDKVLADFGAQKFGTKNEVYGETGRNRNQVCCIFPGRDEVVPVISFVITRVLALLDSRNHLFYKDKTCIFKSRGY